MRTYRIDDEGDYLELHLAQDGEKIGGMLMDVEPMGLDQAFCFLDVVGGAFVAIEHDSLGSQYQTTADMPPGAWKRGAHGTH